jgi:calcium-translocating P-type ATPase
MPFDITTAELQELHNLRKEDETRLHALATLGDGAGIAKKLNSDFRNGIFPKTKGERQELFGVNEYAQPTPKTFLELCIDALNDTTMIILCASAVLSLVIGMVKGGEWYEGVAILMAVVIVTLVTAVNEYQKEQQFQDLNKVKEQITSRVVRGGAENPGMSAAEIVVGDLVRLSEGDKIPADGVVISRPMGNLTSDESSLTGEAEPVRKNDVDRPLLYSGCNIASGDCDMLVTSVGDYSQQGIIRLTLAAREEEPTPLQEKLEDVAELIGWAGLAVAIASFVVLTISWAFDGNYTYQEFVEESSWKALLDFLIIAVTIVAVAVPEGLPLAVTISLAYSMHKMMEDNNLVRKLQACETMGSATNICSDKTGTLTQNRMTVVQGFLCGEHFTVDSQGPTIDNPLKPDNLQQLYRSAALNSTGSCKQLDNGVWEFHGNKTECAILMLTSKLSGDHSMSDTLRATITDTHRMPFNSANKFASVAYSHQGQSELFMTGAPEKVIANYCSYADDGGSKPVPLDAAGKQQRIEQATNLAKQGLRAIALTYKPLAKGADLKAEASAPSDMVLLAIVGIKDPLREDVKDAVKRCQGAGIMVRMVTGDNIHTALHIAQECGILVPDALAIEGPQFASMSDEEIIAKLPNLRVLARSAPCDKQKLVELLQSQGEIVAVTGDGTNDAPALKKANVGLSMGKTGTEVAMDASDIVILDDNFASIVKSVKWGRSVFDNIRKFIQFQLTINIVALTVSFCSAAYCAIPANTPKDTATTSFDTEKCTPLNAIQLLWINLIMDSMGALALATENPSESLLDRKPVAKSASLVSPIMWRNIGVMAAFQLAVLFVLMATPENLGFEAIEFRSRHHYTLLFNVFVWMQIFNEFNSRRLDNTVNCFSGMGSSVIFMGVIISTVVVQYCFIEYGGDYTKTVNLTNDEWARTVGIAALCLPLGFIVRYLQLFVKDEVPVKLKEE